MADKYHMLIHRHGQVVIFGDFTNDEAKAEIERSVPPTEKSPSQIIVEALRYDGHLTIGSWNLVITPVLDW